MIVEGLNAEQMKKYSDIKNITETNIDEFEKPVIRKEDNSSFLSDIDLDELGDDKDINL